MGPDPASPGISRIPASPAPIVDGALDDAVQSEPLPTGEFLSYNPLHGNPIPQKTTICLYDSDYLHVAFKCDDPDPSGIKTLITRRDNIFQDDWVGLSLDALGTGQVCITMMVNPSGVQLDMLNSVAGDEDPRSTGSGTVPAGSPIPDMPWSSACPCRAFASRAASTREWASCSGGA